MKKYIIFICLLLLLVGCNTDADNKPNENLNNDNNEVIEKIDWIVDPESKSRNFAVMINCHNNALPQAGLDKAYLVYELMVEAGITRMMALFKDVDVEKIGSIRSARIQYLDYVLENDAIYAHAGGSPDAIENIPKLNIDDLDVDNSTYGVRDKTLKRDWEHTLFTTTTLLNKGLQNKKFNTETQKDLLLNYSSKEIDLSKYESAIKAEDIAIRYSSYRTSKYNYDSTNKTYLRTMNNTANTDLVTKEQYTVKNIIAYSVKYTSYTYKGYSGYQKISNIGTGEGYYITNGYAIPITWSKENSSSQTVYKIKETNEELIVNNGNTYIQIYPTTGNLTIKSNT